MGQFHSKAYSNMKTIPIDSDNLGGMAHIYAYPATDITVRGYANGTCTIVSMNSDQAVDIPVLNDSSFQFTEQSELQEAGISYEPTISALIPKIRPDISRLLQDMSRNGWIIIHQDANGTILLSGTEEVPLRMTFETSTGESGGSPNGYIITFQAIEPHPSLIVTSFV